jgi:hypothetical protein
MSGAEMVRGYRSLVGILLVLTGCRPITPVSVQPVPRFLDEIVPEPGASYTLPEYDSLASSFLMWEPDADPGICFTVFPLHLLEPGDFPTKRGFLNQIYLVVDGTEFTKYQGLYTTDFPAGELIDPETGEIIAREPEGSPLGVCYSVPLGAGMHSATVVVHKTSGTVLSYTWPFTITR